MSAWLCENKTLSLVADVITSPEWAKEYDEHFYNEMEKDKLVNVLNWYNRRNLDYLYEDGADGFGKSEPVYVELDVSPVQRYKSVRCYLYQTLDYD